MDGIQKPKETDVKEMQYYNEQEISALFEALKDEPLRLRAQIMIAVTTGLRRAEVAGLEWKYINLETGILEVKRTIPKLLNGEPVIKSPKNKKSIRTMALSDAVVQELILFN
jgi:integrase